MARKKRAFRKAGPVTRCPAHLKPGPQKMGICYRIERVQRNRQKGYVTSFFSRLTGRQVGYSSAPGICKKTLDPFQASIRPKTKAEAVGKQCSIQVKK